MLLLIWVNLAFGITVSSIFRNIIDDILIEYDQSEGKYLHVYRRFVKKKKFKL
jgi:hypothetical protein